MAENKGPITKAAGGTVYAHRLVKLDSGAVVHNTVTKTDDPIGVALENASSGDYIAVDPINRGGTFEITSSKVISRDAEVYAGANGTVTDAPGTAGSYRRVGIALATASACGDIIEVMCLVNTDDVILAV